MALDEKDMDIDLKDRKSYLSRDIGNMIKSLLKIWWLFVIVGTLAGVAGIWYSGIKKPVYISHLTFALDEGNGNGIGNFLNLASQFGFTVGGSKDIFTGDNILEIMRSRRMLERVLLSVDTFNNKPYTLIEYFLEITGKRNATPKIKDIHFPPGQPKAKFSYKQDSLLYVTGNDFTDRYLVAQRPDRKLGIYEVNVTSPDEKFTKVFTDRIVAETNNFYIEIRTKKAKETLGILEVRVANMKGNLNTSIQKRADIQDVNINPAFSEAEVPIIKQQTNIQVYGTAYAEMFKNLELARFQYLNAIPLMQIIDAADYPMQKEKMGKLKAAILFAFLSELLVLLIIGLTNVFRKNNLSNNL